MADVWFAAKADSAESALKYLIGGAEVVESYPTTDGKEALIVVCDEKHGRFNANRLGRRGDGVLFDNLEGAQADLREKWRVQ